MVKKSDESDESVRAKLHSMWTPEMFDRFEADIRKLLEASPQYRDRPKRTGRAGRGDQTEGDRDDRGPKAQIEKTQMVAPSERVDLLHHVSLSLLRRVDPLLFEFLTSGERVHESKFMSFNTHEN